MKAITTIVLLTTVVSVQSQAQNLKIKVDNTEPRLGQEINLTMESIFFEDFLNKTCTDSLQFKKSYSNPDLTKTIVANRLGQLTIGPIKFEFNGVNYVSNSIKINVIPNLSDEEGVWIRKMKIEDKEFILIEQISKTEPMTSVTENALRIEWKATPESLVKLIKEPKEQGIEFLDRRSGVGAHPDPSKEHPHSISYSYKFYEIKKSSKFKESFRLKEEHFQNLPKGAKIPNIVID